MKESIPEWRDSWAQGADHSLDGRAGSVATQSDPSVLIGAPLSDVAESAVRHTTEDWRNLTRHEPFQGLVEQHPRRAMAALSLELRHNRDRPEMHFSYQHVSGWGYCFGKHGKVSFAEMCELFGVSLDMAH